MLMHKGTYVLISGKISMNNTRIVEKKFYVNVTKVQGLEKQENITVNFEILKEKKTACSTEVLGKTVYE